MTVPSGVTPAGSMLVLAVLRSAVQPPACCWVPGASSRRSRMACMPHYLQVPQHASHTAMPIDSMPCQQQPAPMPAGAWVHQNQVCQVDDAGSHLPHFCRHSGVCRPWSISLTWQSTCPRQGRAVPSLRWQEGLTCRQPPTL